MKDVINKYFRVFLILELCSTMVSRPLQVSNFYRGVGGGGYFNNIERYLDIYFACLFVWNRLTSERLNPSGQNLVWDLTMT